VHGNGDGAALWQTTFWRFESNGWPRGRLHAIELPYPLARDDDGVPQPGRTSSAEHMAFLKAEIGRVLAATGASSVVLMGSSRGGNAIRNYIQTEQARDGGVVNVSHAILAGTPNHGVFAIKGFREGNEFSGSGPFLARLNAPKNAAGDEVAGPVKWLTLRSDNNDKYAQPFSPGAGPRIATNVSYAGPSLKGAQDVVIARADHREVAFNAAAFGAAWRFITGRMPQYPDWVAQAPIELAGRITGLGLAADDPASGDYGNNLPLAGARLSIHATDAGGGRVGAARHAQRVGADGRWGPFRAEPGVAYEFVIAAPGYATTHIYRSPFPRSSAIVNMAAARIDPADRGAGAIVTLTRPRGYLDPARDQMRFDGGPPPGLPALGAVLADSKLRLEEQGGRAIHAEFNGERITGRTWSAREGHLVFLEITQ
jgi:triacylglycerol lipase